MASSPADLAPYAHVSSILLSHLMALDPRDAQETELSRLLDDSSTRHPYYYQPYVSADQKGAASAPWRHQVCVGMATWCLLSADEAGDAESDMQEGALSKVNAVMAAADNPHSRALQRGGVVAVCDQPHTVAN